MNEYTTNQPIGSTVSSTPFNSGGLAPNYCKVCGSKFEMYEQGWYDEYTGKKVWKVGCSKYGCKEHCFIIGGCIYTRKYFWSPRFICERCGHKWGEYN